MDVIIQLAVRDNVNTTGRGNLLEALSQEILSAQQYDVTRQLRLTGMEVDLLAKHKHNDEVFLLQIEPLIPSLAIEAITCE